MYVRKKGQNALCIEACLSHLRKQSRFMKDFLNEIAKKTLTGI